MSKYFYSNEIEKQDIANQQAAKVAKQALEDKKMEVTQVQAAITTANEQYDAAKIKTLTDEKIANDLQSTMNNYNNVEMNKKRKTEHKNKMRIEKIGDSIFSLKNSYLNTTSVYVLSLVMSLFFIFYLKWHHSNQKLNRKKVLSGTYSLICNKGNAGK